MFTHRLWTLIIYTISLLMTACASNSASDAESLSNANFSRMYQFAGNRDYASRLSLFINQEEIAYSAQVSDFAGKIITTINQTTLQTMEFIIPRGETQYYVNIATEQEIWLDHIELTINPVTQSNSDHHASLMNIAYSTSSVTCEMWVTQTDMVYLYNQPHTRAQTVLTLPANVPLIPDARTLDGWYRLTMDGNTSWVNGNEVHIKGDCANLPVDTMIQPDSTSEAVSTAPYDVDRHYFAINANQGGVFTNDVSYPNGDSMDIIQATLTNSQADRTIGIVMTCNGNGIETLQWGQSQNTALRCGDTLELGFAQNAHDTQLTVLLPAVSGQQYVDYQLTAMPIAPNDEEQHVLPVDRNQGGVIQQMVSYPAGDTRDVIALYAHNLQDNLPENYREMTLVMRCDGSLVDYLRWGLETASLRCGDSLILPVSLAENIRYLTVYIPPHQGHSYIDYTLYALPSAPADNTFWFGVDRDDGGTFNETLSSPVGDNADTIEIVMGNLTQTTPNHFREMTLTLLCDGFNQANIRWGLPGNPQLSCGQTVTTAFIYSANQQAIEIVALDTNQQSYVNYTLVVEPKLSQSILKNGD